MTYSNEYPADYTSVSGLPGAIRQKGVNLKELIDNNESLINTNEADISQLETGWLELGIAPTYVDSNTFKISGDQTDIFVDNRRIKATLDASIAYSAASSSSYDSGNDETTVTISDSVLDSTLQKVEYGLVEPGNKGSLPRIVPTGATFWIPSNTIPNGYLKCDGTYISKTTYSELYNVIGTLFGESGDNFKLPDLRSEFIRGADDGRGVSGGHSLGTSQSSQNKSHDHTADNSGWHNHNGSTTTDGNHNHTYYSHYNEFDKRERMPEAGNSAADTSQNTTSSDGSHSHSLNINGAGSHNHNINSAGGSESRPRNIALMPIIKY